MRSLTLGERGKEVVDIQAKLHAQGHQLGPAGINGYFGPDTLQGVQAFQRRRGLLCDGVVGPNTWNELVEASLRSGERLLYLRIPEFRGDDVAYLQGLLNQLGFNGGPIDGIFGEQTEHAVLDFQKNSGLGLDGMVDEEVIKRLETLRKAGPVGLHKIPDRYEGYPSYSSLKERRIAVDPAYGGDPAQGRTPGGRTLGECNLSLALALQQALENEGAQVFLTRCDDHTVALYDRTAAINEAACDLCLCLNHNSEPSGKASGVATYYFSRSGYYSEAGSRLADELASSVAGCLGNYNLGAHGRAYAVLRETKIPCVVVEPGFITHPQEGARLEDKKTQALIAGALARGLKAYVEKKD